jgi:hypothetical protein
LGDFFQSKTRDPNGFQFGTLSRNDLNLSLADPEPLGKELNEGFVRFFRLILRVPPKEDLDSIIWEWDMKSWIWVDFRRGFWKCGDYES